MIWWLTASALLLAGAAMIVAFGFRSAAPETPLPTTRAQRAREVPRLATDYLERAGISIAPERIWLTLAALSIACSACLVLLPIRYGSIAVAALLLALHLSVHALGERRRRLTLVQLPSFLNQVIRRVGAGASVELAITDSLDSIAQPLQGILDRAVRRVRLGYELHDSLEREAAITGLSEFHMLAIVLRLNEQFGGSIRGVLENIVDLLLTQQQGQRELKALTGETRITAVVLSVLPVAAAGYMLAINPNFFLDMWNDPFGHQLLIIAAVLELLGVTVLWRMVNSI